MRFHSCTLIAAAAIVASAVPALADGDVSLSAGGRGGLTLVGDAMSNSIEIVPGKKTGTLIVRGTNNTTINGSSEARIRRIRRLNLDMGVGNDNVLLDGVRLPGALHVRLGDGGDRLEMLGVRVRGVTTIRGGAGDDDVVAEDGCRFRRTVRIRTEDGDDVVTVNQTTFRERLRVLMGDGDDYLEVTDTTTREAASADLFPGRGDDRVLVAADAFGAPVRLFTTAGDDRVEVYTSTFMGQLECLGGRGFDDFALEDCRFVEPPQVDTGGRRNRLSMRRNIVSASATLF